ALVPRRSMRTPRPAFTNEQSRRSSVSANRALIGTLSAWASATRVASDGEIAPFSIFDSMPAEIPAARPSSATVKSSDLRRRRTSAPIPASSVGGASSCGASEPVRRSASPRWRRRLPARAALGGLRRDFIEVSLEEQKGLQVDILFHSAIVLIRTKLPC